MSWLSRFQCFSEHGRLKFNHLFITRSRKGLQNKTTPYPVYSETRPVWSGQATWNRANDLTSKESSRLKSNTVVFSVSKCSRRRWTCRHAGTKVHFQTPLFICGLFFCLFFRLHSSVEPKEIVINPQNTRWGWINPRWVQKTVSALAPEWEWWKSARWGRDSRWWRASWSKPITRAARPRVGAWPLSVVITPRNASPIWERGIDLKLKVNYL